jgi:hypothetical protein
VVTLTSLLALTVVAYGQGKALTPTDEPVTRPEGWTDETHGNDAEPNYDVVFPQDEVNQIKITIALDDWAAMQANMSGLFGEPGTQLPNRQPGIGGIGPDGGGVPGDLFPDDGGDTEDEVQQPIPSWANMTGENPVWVPATIEFDGLTWTNVGICYKGNSSLISSWRNGDLKLPFKLDFDEFEDENPEILNQRFYGLKQR